VLRLLGLAPTNISAKDQSRAGDASTNGDAGLNQM
jgi:hypothetical protein